MSFLLQEFCSALDRLLSSPRWTSYLHHGLSLGGNHTWPNLLVVGALCCASVIVETAVGFTARDTVVGLDFMATGTNVSMGDTETSGGSARIALPTTRTSQHVRSVG